MSLDGIVTRSIVKELNELIVGGRIDKIYQQEKDEVLINIRNRGVNNRLLISASSNNPRIYLTEGSKENPQSPPMFCMLLRKYLSGGTILNIQQHSLDRIILIDISSMDELGQPSENRLIIEIMGRHSNVILVHKESLKIIDSIRRVPEHISRVRQVLPGLTYEYPPLGEKANALNSSKEEFYKFLEEEIQKTPVFKFLYFNYIGFSPLISREICFQSNINPSTPIGDLTDQEKESLFNIFNIFVQNIEEGVYSPLYVKSDNDSILGFHALDLRQFGNENKYHEKSISKVLNTFYEREDNLDRISQSSQSMKRIIQTKLERSTNKLEKQEIELEASKDREKYKVYADLISANIYAIPPGSDFVKLDNFYDENMAKLGVPLDKKVSPVINAQNYYKRFSKLKTAESLLLKQIPITKNEISYLENVLLSMDNATEVQDLIEIREELVKEGYLKDNKRNNRKRKKQADSTSNPHHYISQDGFHIYVGKNNRQNDYLTLKFAHQKDLWLHTENMPGSHVVIKVENQEVPKTTLREAALLAAYYSKGRNSDNVSIIFTEKKNVKKPRNSKPGMVIYENYSSLVVSPHQEKIDKIKKVEA